MSRSAGRSSMTTRTIAGGSWATSSGSPSARCTRRRCSRCAAIARHRDFARVGARRATPIAICEYPNKDNVLGPTRLFFSTYLESIWLLQLVVALDLLEIGDARSVATLGSDACASESSSRAPRSSRATTRGCRTDRSGTTRRSSRRRGVLGRPLRRVGARTARPGCPRT